MAENVMNNQRTKHVDVQYHFVQKFVVDGYIKIIFVKMDENCADMFTKNVSSGRYKEHAGNFIATTEEMGFEKQNPLKCCNKWCWNIKTETTILCAGT